MTFSQRIAADKVILGTKPRCFEVLSVKKSLRKTGTGRHVNMFAAFLHVSADFMRSTSTTVMSLLILLCKAGAV